MVACTPRAIASNTSLARLLESRLSKEVTAVDVLIAGGGPSGLGLAAAASSMGLSVALVDPVLTLEWPNNYGVWVDEFESLGTALRFTVLPAAQLCTCVKG